MFTPLESLGAVSVADTLRGGRAVVDLWYYCYEREQDADLLRQHRALLTADEVNRLERFHFERDRRMFLATRALVRTALSEYASVAPQAWRFAAREHGKPYIVHPAVRPELHFNLANTKGLVVCAVSCRCANIGVDAETTERSVERDEIADAYFSPLEAAALRALPPADRPPRFLSYWTLKESYIKARGLGLAIPLDQFSFLLDDGPIRISFDPRLNDHPARWRFSSLATARHCLAVAADAGNSALCLRSSRTVPLRPEVH